MRRLMLAVLMLCAVSAVGQDTPLAYKALVKVTPQDGPDFYGVADIQMHKSIFIHSSWTHWVIRILPEHNPKYFPVPPESTFVKTEPTENGSLVFSMRGWKMISTAIEKSVRDYHAKSSPIESTFAWRTKTELLDTGEVQIQIFP